MEPQKSLSLLAGLAFALAGVTPAFAAVPDACYFSPLTSDSTNQSSGCSFSENTSKVNSSISYGPSGATFSGGSFLYGATAGSGPFTFSFVVDLADLGTFPMWLKDTTGARAFDGANGYAWSFEKEQGTKYWALGNDSFWQMMYTGSTTTGEAVVTVVKGGAGSGTVTFNFGVGGSRTSIINPVTPPVFSGALYVGGWLYRSGWAVNEGKHWNTKMRCLRFWDSALSASEVAELDADCGAGVPEEESGSNIGGTGACVPVTVPSFSGATYAAVVFTGSSPVDNATYYAAGGVWLRHVDFSVVGVSGVPTSGVLSSVANGASYFSGVTDAAVGWNPLTWANSVPRYVGHFTKTPVNRLQIITDFTGATDQNAFFSSQLSVKYYVTAASGGWLLPTNGDPDTNGTDWIETWKPVSVYKETFATGARYRFESSRPIAAFKFEMPNGKAVRFRSVASTATYPTVVVSSCSNDPDFGGPNVGSGWDELIGPDVPGAAGIIPSEWFARLGWTRNYLADFVFSVPLTATSATVRVPLPVPQAGGRGLSVALVDVTLSDIDDHSPVWTGGVFVYEDGLRSSATYDGPVAISEGSGYLTALLAAGFYLFVRVALILGVFYLVTIVTTLLVSLTNVAFPVVSDKFANINISASGALSSGASGAFSAVAWVSVAAVMGTVYVALLNFGVQVWGYLGSSVLDWVNFLTFGFLRNVGADWTVFAVTVNVVGNTLFAGVLAYSVWRVVQYIGKV